jgi:hypothetical protein
MRKTNLPSRKHFLPAVCIILVCLYLWWSIREGYFIAKETNLVSVSITCFHHNDTQNVNLKNAMCRGGQMHGAYWNFIECARWQRIRIFYVIYSVALMLGVVNYDPKGHVRSANLSVPSPRWQEIWWRFLESPCKLKGLAVEEDSFV